ncbi:MAG: methylenetetrahydrofolate reductase [Desulfurococcales archaeon]|nr:methylenetetrahydrofolate reductase [Desulfurococcales archaeon]
MELVAELDPPRDPKKLLEIVSGLARIYDWIDIPDAPLGKPNYNSPVISAYLTAHGYKVIAHLRTSDVNTIALKTITKTLGALGVRRIVYLKGDPPQQGSSVGDFTPEQAVYYARTRPEAPEPGLLLSLRKPITVIRERLRVPAGFYLVLNYDWEKHSTLSLLSQLKSEAPGKRFYVYAIIREECTRSTEEVVEGAKRLQWIAEGLVISSPARPACLYSIGERIREELVG